MTQLRISAKNLGAVALPGFCPRCFWLKLHAKSLPYQIFPGIFSSIDAYTKRVVHGWLDDLGAPRWLACLGDVVGYIDPPSYHTFQTVIQKENILLTGAADGILRLADGTIAIVDYKTAKYTANQDALLPMYAVQLNAYALIAEAIDMGTVSKIALMYCEPVTDEATARTNRVRLGDGFHMPLAVSIHQIELRPECLSPLLALAREIYDLPEAPDGRTECKECKKLDNLLALIKAS